jgi:DnaJ-class molecular chaperone
MTATRAQRELFPDPDQPCTTCKGGGIQPGSALTGQFGGGFFSTCQPCLSCGGTGLQKDRPNPATNPLPEGY